MEFKNVKIDLRDDNGSIDKRKSREFQFAVTGGDHSKYYRSGLVVLEDVYAGWPFMYVDSTGILSSNDDEDYFKTHVYQEIEFTYDVKYTVTKKENPRIQEIKKDLEYYENEMAKLKNELSGLEGGARPTHELVMADEDDDSTCTGCCFSFDDNNCEGKDSFYASELWGFDCGRREEIWKIVEIKR